MKKFKVGEYLFVWAFMCVVQVKSIRKNGMVTSLWVEDKHKNEFSMNSLDDGLFVAKIHRDGKISHETGVTKIKSLINIAGLVILLSILIYFFGG